MAFSTMINENIFLIAGNKSFYFCTCRSLI